MNSLKANSQPERATPPCVRLLGLGNDLLADDAFGILVANEVRERIGDAADVVTSAASGFHLLDDVMGSRRLVVVDTIVTGSAEPGTLRLLTEEQVRCGSGSSPHFLGLFDVLRTARAIGLDVPDRVAIVAIEAFDCTTVGGPMHPQVRAAITAAATMAMEQMTLPEVGP